jgi:hypothetical protein
LRMEIAPGVGAAHGQSLALWLAVAIVEVRSGSPG